MPLCPNFLSSAILEQSQTQKSLLYSQRFLQTEKNASMQIRRYFFHLEIKGARCLISAHALPRSSPEFEGRKRDCANTQESSFSAASTAIRCEYKHIYTSTLEIKSIGASAIFTHEKIECRSLSANSALICRNWCAFCRRRVCARSVMLRSYMCVQMHIYTHWDQNVNSTPSATLCMACANTRI